MSEEMSRLLGARIGRSGEGSRMPSGGPYPANPPRFDHACSDVVGYLRTALPIGAWTVTRFDGENQVFLTVDDTFLGLASGTTMLWSDSMCQYATVGDGITVVTDTRCVPEHAAVIDKSGLPVGSYVGYPLTTSDGQLFGTLCGFDRGPFPAELEQSRDLIMVLASLLSQVLEADLYATAAQRRLEAAQRTADTDALTGLVNRNGWQRLLEDENDRYRRFGDPGQVIVVDLDDLKTVNDTLGHHAGDEHLQRAARLMSEVVDVPAVIARIGGDEFAVLLHHASRGTATDVVDRLRVALQAGGVSASLGHAPYSWVGGLDGAWRSADAAMYEEKSGKRRSSSRVLR